MNGASASAGAGAGAGAGGEGPLVYEAWKGSNVSGMPLLSLYLCPSAPFLPPVASLSRGWCGSACFFGVETQINCFVLPRNRY
jgi:hypothetical protein